MTTQPAQTLSHVVEEDFPDATRTYVVNLLEVPAPMDGAIPGFNLDNMDSGPTGSMAADADCQQAAADYVSSVDPNQIGVDNALGPLLSGVVNQLLVSMMMCPTGTPSCINYLINQQITMGRVLLLVEVTGVNSYEYDDSIGVQLYLGALPAGTTTPMIDSTNGLLAAGQTFATTLAIGTQVDGDIFNGRLRVKTPLLPVMIAAGTLNLTLMILNPELRFNITESALTNGVIGGYVAIADILAAATSAGIDATTARGLVQPYADIMPGTDPLVCDSLSIGVTASAATAVRTPM
jgi:hypothetical protein